MELNNRKFGGQVNGSLILRLDTGGERKAKHSVYLYIQEVEVRYPLSLCKYFSGRGQLPPQLVSSHAHAMPPEFWLCCPIL